MNPLVDQFLVNGCGRCPLGGTPECKVNNWQDELRQLRLLVLESGLTEEVKWGFPTYTLSKKNILMVAVFKEFVTISFFKGSLLKDPYKMLAQQGKNSQAVRILKFTNLLQIKAAEGAISEYITEAITIEKAGLKVDFKQKHELEYPEELTAKFEEDPALSEAFEALTPGRKRGYVLHFAGAKQSKTRTSRIEKFIPKIMTGKGFHD